MPTAFDMIGHNPALQEHWIRRLFAFLIDVIIISVVTLFFSIPFALFIAPWWIPSFVFGLLWFIYSMFLELVLGATIGKKLVSLRVVAIDGNMDIMHALIRNITKVFPIFVLLDVLVGAATQGDPRQRYLDRIARTTVTRVDQGAYMEEQFRMMQHAPPFPMTPQGTYPGSPPPAQSPPPPQSGGQAAPATGGWPGQTPAPSGWPQHQWDEQGQLVREMKFCTACGGQLVARGDGKLTCVRCGAVY